MTERSKLISSFTGDRPGMSEVSTRIPKGDIETANSLHNQIASFIDKSIQNALLIGEILDKNRTALGHGKFKAWFESNSFTFSLRHAKRYLYLYENKAQLEGTHVSLSMREAFKLLSESDRESNEEKEINPPKRNPADLYKEFKDGKNLTKADRSALKDWLSEKAESYKSKASEIEKEIRKLK